MDRFLTIKETALRFKVSKSSLYRLIRGDPTFPSRNIGHKKKFVIREADLADWLASRSIREEIIKLPSHTVVIRRIRNG